MKGEGVEKSLARILEFLLVGDDDFLVPLGEDGVDAGLEDVALGPLEQTRVDPPADDGFEYLSTLGLFHHHALAKLAVDGHGEARNGLSFPEGKVEPSLEHAVEIVVKIHTQGGDREVSHHLYVDRELVHAQRDVFRGPSSLDGLEHYLGSLGDALEATVSGHGLGQACLGFFLRYLNAGDFALVNQNGIDDALLEPAFTGWLEGDRPVVKDAGNFALDQGEVGPFD